MQYTNGVPVYRYMDVALMLAEICNELDEPGNTKKWIDIVRKRAFGKEMPFTYTGQGSRRGGNPSGTGAEFAAESKRWYDVRRICGGNTLWRWSAATNGGCCGRSTRAFSRKIRSSSRTKPTK